MQHNVLYMLKADKNKDTARTKKPTPTHPYAHTDTHAYTFSQ